MTSQTIMTIGQHALYMLLLISAPMLLSGLIVGLVVSLVQAATQINESTLSFIPKLVAMVIVLMVAGPWMLNTLIDFIRRMLEAIPSSIG